MIVKRHRQRHTRLWCQSLGKRRQQLRPSKWLQDVRDYTDHPRRGRARGVLRLVGHLAGTKAGRHRVNRDLARPQFHRQVAGEMVDRGLAGGVGIGTHPRHGGDMQARFDAGQGFTCSGGAQRPTQGFAPQRSREFTALPPAHRGSVPG